MNVRAIATPDTGWSQRFKLPPSGNMMAKGPDAQGVFVRQGTRMFAVIERCILAHGFDRPIPDLSILDFGCGNGRVALPFFDKYHRPSVCADVDPQVIAYLKEAIPGANPIKTGYEPPLPFADQSFDVIYALSVWTHLPAEHQSMWLTEIARILKDDGLALLSTSSYAALASRRRTLPAWRDVTDIDLKEQGFIFKASPPPRGVTGVYGYAAHDPEWVRRHWANWFEVRETKLGAIEGVQDLHVLSKRRQPSRATGRWFRRK